MAKRGFPGANAPDKPTKFVLPNRLFSDPAVILAPTEGSVVIAGVVSALTLILAPLVGAIILAGNAPSITQVLAPTTGAVVVAGQTPSLLKAFSPSSGAIVVAGETTAITQGALLSPSEGQLIIGGQIPALSFYIVPSEGSVVVDGLIPTVLIQAPEATTSAAAGIPARDVRRRRYIMPDDRVFEATTDEILALLRLYAVPKESPPRKEVVIRVPQITLQNRDVRFVPTDEKNTYRAIINERFAYKAPPEDSGQAEIVANRMRANEEAILALIL